MSKTALFAAAKSWDSRIVRQLLVQSPDLVRARDAKGRTALHICAGASAASHRARVAVWTVIWSKEPRLVRLLLDAGSRIEVRFDGETPLIYAAKLGREKAVLELVAAGADITARDSKGRTPADYARKKRMSQAVLTALGEQQTVNPALNRTRRKRHVG